MSTQKDFRGQLSTIEESGKRKWIFPKKPSGKLYNARTWVSIFLLGLFFGGPFITIGGQPLLLFNIFDRKFVIMGSVFWPQDTHLLIFLMLIFVVFVLLFTVAFGRVWCGWACPQTIFMEMVYRKIEYWIEGDWTQQKKLNNAPWTSKKIIKKSSKQIIFLAIATLVAHTFMAYILGIKEMTAVIQQGPAANMSGFIGLIVFTGIFYFVFAYFREQACTLVCPYGRLQGVFLDKKSIVVIYDWLRGEPRKKLRKAENNLNAGDCIDCNLCVNVCPTGIDIRNGTQMECVNCTACIDACDTVMEKINRPKGLIRFDSIDGVEKKVKKLFSPRIIAYSVVLIALLGIMSFLLISRAPIEATVTRVPGSLYTMKNDSTISNLYQVELINKSFENMKPEIKSLDQNVTVFIPTQSIGLLEAESKKVVHFFVEMPLQRYKKEGDKISLELSNEKKSIEIIKTRFYGPRTY